ncbi:hypothetical protein [Rummeliibacillus sp. SL167]|uniref:hypothetical protein n=1 Tax=Rummeliibacillus sp. SL167 TaxID=2579792 RepID=UPI001644A050|nr:hypothetical protein [Rummeliibacillus sp. SL167]
MKKKIIMLSFIGVLAVGLLAFSDVFKASEEKDTTTYQPIVNEDTVTVTEDELK